MAQKQYGCGEEHLAHYTCRRTPDPISIDGSLDKPIWKAAEKSPRFVDLVGGTPGFYDTRAALAWDDANLYLAYWIEEPFVQAELTKRDSLIYNENDVEFFIAGPDCYYEFEINARGTVYEVFFIWQDAYAKDSRFAVPEFDLLSQSVDLLGGFQDPSRFGNHPRGARWAFRDWDFPGMESAVQIQGTLNDHSDIDQGWTVELAFPWSGMKWLAADRPLPPKNGDVWRMDFSRFEKLQNCGKTLEPHPGWAWNRHGVYDSHVPECFTYIHFSDEAILTKL